MLGVTFGGVVDGVVTRVAPQPTTYCVLGVRYGLRAAVTSFDSARVDILQWLDNTVPAMRIVGSSTAHLTPP